RAYCLKTQPATGETYPKSDLFNKAPLDIKLDNILPPEPYTQNREKIFLKLTLPCSKAKDLLKFLLQQGYGEARIYPGYKGIANQVMRKYK
ncbi:hypothetical protein NXF60_28545, partial [Klebsiella pneumoniae]|nr:hypothetical protein [Klebsiella pneumoniae]